MHSCKGLVDSGPFKNNQCGVAYQMIKNSKNNKEADIWCMKTNNCELIHKDTIELHNLEKKHHDLKKKHIEEIEKKHMKENEVNSFVDTFKKIHLLYLKDNEINSLSDTSKDIPSAFQNEIINFNEQKKITQMYIEDKNKTINNNQVREEKLLSESQDYKDKIDTTSRKLDYSYDTYRYYNNIFKLSKYFIIFLIIIFFIIIAYKNKNLIQKYIKILH